MRQDHNILVTKLSDMGVPPCLLQIVISFLSDRKMSVLYKGKKSSIRSMPGGGPQGTILALLLFLVLVNDIGFKNQENNTGDLATAKRDLKVFNEIHLKYVDDLTLAEAVDMPLQLAHKDVHERQLPDRFECRTGHFLPPMQSKVFKQLLKTQEYAELNSMRINFKKTKIIIFNPCKSKDFFPEFNLDGYQLEVMKEIKILGVTITSDLKWHSNTKNMVVKACKRLWILRRLKSLGADQEALLDIYTKQIRSILELAAPAWQGALTQSEKNDLERIQRAACHIILGSTYVSYSQSLKALNIQSLEHRRNKLSIKFAKKAEKNHKFKNWFKVNQRKANTRQVPTKYLPVRANHARYLKSPISFLTKLLNTYHSKH